MIRDIPVHHDDGNTAHGAPVVAVTSKRRVLIVLVALLATALVLRLIYGLGQNHNIEYFPGSNDSGWYLVNGYTLVTGQMRGDTIVYVNRLSTAPLYLVFVGIPQAFLPLETAVIVIRILQAIMSTAMCFFAYRLAIRLTNSERVGLIAAGIMAISPAFIVEAAQVTTETLYMFLLAGGMWLIAEYIAMRGENAKLLVLSAVLFGLATLTRAVLLAYPLALAALLIFLFRKAGIKRAAVFTAIFAAVVLTWTVYNLARWNRFVIAGDGFFSFIYIGTSGWDDPYEFDQRLLTELGREGEQPVPGSGDAGDPATSGDPAGSAGSSDPVDPADTSDPPLTLRQEDYAQAAAQNITENPLGWVERRVSELVGAYLMPHATTNFGGESLRDIALTWVREDRSVSGLITLTQGDHFWVKLSLYVFHYGVILLGLIGIFKTRHSWRISLPMLGFIGYVTLVHLVLYALPRYLFPAMIFWIVYAASVFTPAAIKESTP